MINNQGVPLWVGLSAVLLAGSAFVGKPNFTSRLRGAAPIPHAADF